MRFFGRVYPRNFPQTGDEILSKPPRIDRKSLKNPDEFVAKGRATVDFFFRQRSRFLPVVILAVVLVAGVYGYDYWTNRKLEKGWLEYQVAMKAPVEQRWDKLKTLHNEQKSGRPAFFAAVVLADHYFDEAKKESLKDGAAPSAVAAVEWYGRAMENPSLLSSEKQLLLVNRGGALEIEKKFDEALGEYQKAADLAGEGKGLALLNLARIYEIKGDKAKASEIYEKVSMDYMNTEYAKFSKNSLRRLKSPLFEASKS